MSTTKRNTKKSTRKKPRKRRQSKMYITAGQVFDILHAPKSPIRQMMDFHAAGGTHQEPGKPYDSDALRKISKESIGMHVRSAGRTALKMK